MSEISLNALFFYLFFTCKMNIYVLITCTTFQRSERTVETMSFCAVTASLASHKTGCAIALRTAAMVLTNFCVVVRVLIKTKATDLLRDLTLPNPQDQDLLFRQSKIKLECFNVDWNSWANLIKFSNQHKRKIILSCSSIIVQNTDKCETKKEWENSTSILSICLFWAVFAYIFYHSPCWNNQLQPL